MRNTKCRTVTYALICMAMMATGAAKAAAPESPLPAFVNWSYAGAYQEDSGCRTRISLNGWWRWYPADTNSTTPPKTGWFYRKAPGYGLSFDILDASGTQAVATAVTPAQRQGVAWIEREFTIPQSWKDKEVCLYLGCPDEPGDVWLDGTLAGYSWVGTSKLVIPKPYRFDTPYRLTVRSKGLLDDTWLAALNPGARITDNQLITSVEDMTATLRASGSGPAGLTLKVIVSEYLKPQAVVKTSSALAAEPSGEGAWKIKGAFPWKEAKLWSLEHPNLYQYVVELADAKGAILDRTHPQRFGFRQFDIKDGRFRLNLKPIIIVNDVHSGTGPGPGTIGRCADAELNKKIVNHWKAVGVNCVEYRWGMAMEDDPFLRATDELGLLVSVAPWGVDAGEMLKNVPEVVASTRNGALMSVVPKRDCPSVICYTLGGTHSVAPCYDYHPDQLGEDFDKGLDHNLGIREFLKQVDPTRISYSCSGGGKYEPIHGSMNYIPPDADLQVHENWPSKWAKARKRPLITYEMAAPTYVSNWQGRRDRGEQHAPQPFVLEVGAIHLGEQPFLNESKSVMSNLFKAAAAKSSSGPYGTWTYDETAKLFVRNVLRAWRAYGANPGLFLMVRDWHTDSAVTPPQKEIDPRRPGAYADKPISTHTWMLKPKPGIWDAAYAGLSPLLAYIGGPDGEFARKDRSFWAGETVRKAVVVINNTEDDVSLSGDWVLALTNGQPVLSGKIPTTVYTPGELGTARVHIEFKAPAAAQRTDYVLTLRGKATREGVLEDRFDLTVFPRPPNPVLPPAMKVLLYDPIGDTAALLQKAGVAFEHLKEMPMPGQDVLLVVGRNALKSPENSERFKKFISPKLTYDFATTFPIGMRVLVFEQELSNIWGMKTEESRWRRSFVRASGHPVFAGLEEVDFSYFRGDSNLAEAFPPAPPMPKRLCIERFPEWGNDNVVTTLPIYKPQEGSCRALLDCGFGLLETPLLEYAAGKGRMIFCQVDVSNRYGTDPVATVLVNNLLTYIATAPAPDPGMGQPIDLVREGWQDYGVSVVETNLYMADKPAGNISWGIGLPNLYFQAFVTLPVMTDPAGKLYLYGTIKGQKRFAHMLNKRNLKTGWQKMNAAIVRSALAINQGGADKVFPEPSLQGDKEILYPINWYESDGYVDPYLLMQW